MSDPAMARALQAMGWPDYKSQGLHTGMFFFVPSDFDMRRPMATGLSDDTIYAEIRKLPCRKIILLDACRSGGAGSKDALRCRLIAARAPSHFDATCVTC